MNAAPFNLINRAVISSDLTLHRQIPILHAAHAHLASLILRSKQNPPPFMNRGGEIDPDFRFSLNPTLELKSGHPLSGYIATKKLIKNKNPPILSTWKDGWGN